MNNLEACIHDATCWLELRPDCGEGFHLRGIALERAGRLEESIADYTKAIELSPAFAEAWAARGWAKGVAGDTAGGLADYNHAIQLNTEKYYYGRACTYWRNGDLQLALDDLTHAVKLSPTDSYILCERAKLYQNMGLHAEAAADYKQALAIDLKFNDKCQGYRGN